VFQSDNDWNESATQFKTYFETFSESFIRDIRINRGQIPSSCHKRSAFTAHPSFRNMRRAQGANGPTILSSVDVPIPASCSASRTVASDSSSSVSNGLAPVVTTALVLDRHRETIRFTEGLCMVLPNAGVVAQSLLTQVQSSTGRTVWIV
jgi:hypothetical protein